MGTGLPAATTVAAFGSRFIKRGEKKKNPHSRHARGASAESCVAVAIEAECDSREDAEILQEVFFFLSLFYLLVLSFFIACAAAASCRGLFPARCQAVARRPSLRPPIVAVTLPLASFRPEVLKRAFKQKAGHFRDFSGNWSIVNNSQASGDVSPGGLAGER